MKGPSHLSFNNIIIVDGGRLAATHFDWLLHIFSRYWNCLKAFVLYKRSKFNVISSGDLIPATVSVLLWLYHFFVFCHLTKVWLAFIYQKLQTNRTHLYVRKFVFYFSLSFNSIPNCWVSQFYKNEAYVENGCDFEIHYIC